MEDEKKQINNVDEFMKLESFMLPPQFRRRSEWKQRLKMIFITMVYSASMGLFAYTIIGGLKENFHIVTNRETTYFLIGIIMPAILMFVFGIYVAWSRSRTYVISTTGMIGYIIPPVILAAGILYMDLLHDQDIMQFLELNGYATLAAGGATVIFVLIRNLLKTKTYREAKLRSILTTPGILMGAIAPYLLKILTDGKSIEDAGNGPLYIALGVFAGGIIVFAGGIALSTKYMLSPEKNIWNAIRFTSGLPALVIYTMLIALSMSKASKAPIILPIIMEAVVEFLILGGFIAYLFFKGRIKNMNKTNPLYNEIALKIFMIAVLTITLIMIYGLPTMTKQKGYGEYSFALLAVGATIIVIGIMAAHFMNLITYNKYNKAVMAGIAFSTVLIYGIALVIASLQQAQIIADIIGRQLTLTFAMITLVFQLITLSINLSYVFKSVAIKPKMLKGKDGKQKKKEGTK